MVGRDPARDCWIKEFIQPYVLMQYYLGMYNKNVKSDKEIKFAFVNLI